MSIVKRNPGTTITMTTTPADPEHEHYPWGASAAAQWRGCPGSINFISHLREQGEVPDDETSEFAEEGTKAHDYADKVLKEEITPEEVPSEFWEHLAGYVSFAKDLIEEAGEHHQVFNEHTISLFYASGKPSTLDFGVVQFNPEDFADIDRVSIMDLKYGKGVPVEVEENDQQIIYAYSLIKELLANGHTISEDTPVDIYIYQPRHWQFDGLPTKWSTSFGALLDYSIDVEKDYHESVAAGSDALTPSEYACKFCPAKKHGKCPAINAELFSWFPEEVNPFKTTEIVTEDFEVTDEVRRLVAQHSKAIASWMDDLNKDSLRRLEEGEEIHGLKPVDGKKGNRQWLDQDKAENMVKRYLPLEERYKPRAIISPTQAVAKFKKLEDITDRVKKNLEKLIFQPEGKPALALEDDKRPARIPKVEAFDDESEPDMEDLI